MVWIVVIATGVVSVLAVPLVLAWWRQARSVFRYPDEEDETAAAQTAKDAEIIVRLGQTSDADSSPPLEQRAIAASNGER